eukprot:295270-Rhodomonas_salina.1
MTHQLLPGYSEASLYSLDAHRDHRGSLVNADPTNAVQAAVYACVPLHLYHGWVRKRWKRRLQRWGGCVCVQLSFRPLCGHDPECLIILASAHHNKYAYRDIDNDRTSNKNSNGVSTQTVA